jgi:citrate synthase
MTEKPNPNAIHSSIWLEESEPNNPFATRAAYCRGYDVYGEMLGNARWVDMLYLLFSGEAPSRSQAESLEILAIALANPGPRDASVHAAMCGGVGGSTSAACLMAALAVGAGQLAGGREITLAMQQWIQCGTDMDAWQRMFNEKPEARESIWPAAEHPPGFDPHGVSTATTTRQTLSVLARRSGGHNLNWLEKNVTALEAAAGCPLTLTGVAAAAFGDLGFTPEKAEMMYLFMRLPGAAAHALEQRELGYKKFPFGVVELTDCPGGEAT